MCYFVFIGSNKCVFAVQPALYVVVVVVVVVVMCTDVMMTCCVQSEWSDGTEQQLVIATCGSRVRRCRASIVHVSSVLHTRPCQALFNAGLSTISSELCTRPCQALLNAYLSPKSYSFLQASRARPTEPAAWLPDQGEFCHSSVALCVVIVGSFSFLAVLNI